jgi:hypothetical protein
MRKKYFLLPIILVCIAARIYGQIPNWSEQIAPIIYNKCTSCHRPGEIAPFSLTNFEEAQAWGEMIKYVTQIRYMPPWKPDPDYGASYLQENYLTDAEIAEIQAWVDGGMPQGNSSLEPELPEFPEGSQVGTPDLVLSFAQTHIHPGNGEDEYRYFVLPTGLTQPKNLVALEMRPGNKSIVHHALIWADSSGIAANLDAQTPEYGYLGQQSGGAGGGGLASFGTQLPAYVPGVRPHIYTNGIAQRIPANADLVVQVHYAPTPIDEPDSSTFNLFFTEQSVSRYVRSKIMVPQPGTLLNGPFFIPANQIRTFHGVWTVPQEISMLGVAPHMHLLGTHWEVFAVTPTNDTIPLVRINDWDFNWQGGYYFRRLIRLPANTRIHAIAGYDNTINNPNNPTIPPRNVTWGEGTADEMYYLPLLYVPYLPGDEQLELDDLLNTTEDPIFHFSKSKLYPLWPNPVDNGMVRVGYTLDRTQSFALHIIDANGRIVKIVSEEKLGYVGEHFADVDVSQLQAGIYYVTLTTSQDKYTQPLVIK